MSTSWEKIRRGEEVFRGDVIPIPLKDGREISTICIHSGEEPVFIFSGVFWFRRMDEGLPDFLEGEILPLLPEDLTELIRPREIDGRSFLLWLPSYEELFGDVRPGDFARQAYTNREFPAREVKDTSERDYWLRTPSGENSYFYVGDIFAESAPSDSVLGIRPCFTIRREELCAIELFAGGGRTSPRSGASRD